MMETIDDPYLHPDTPEYIRELFRERDRLREIFSWRFDKASTTKIQYKTDSLTGVLLDRQTGAVDHSWGDISELQILQAQRLWAVEQKLHEGLK